MVLDFNPTISNTGSMAINRKKILKKINFYPILFISVLSLILLSFTYYKHLSSWKYYKNKDTKISFMYPADYRVKPVRLDSSNIKTLYIYSDKNEEIIRIHYYPNSCDKEVGDFLIGTKNINNISWQIELFPKGLNNGAVELTAPILYYIACENGNKYSLEFKNRTTLDDTQSKIINNFFIQ